MPDDGRTVAPAATSTGSAPLTVMKSWIVKSAGKVAASEPAHRVAAGFIGLGSALRGLAESAQKQLGAKPR